MGVFPFPLEEGHLPSVGVLIMHALFALGVSTLEVSGEYVLGPHPIPYSVSG